MVGSLNKYWAVDLVTTGVSYTGAVKFLHTLPFGLFLFTDQPVAFLHALTAKLRIPALSFAVLPVTY
jgi:hypothetical protein